MRTSALNEIDQPSPSEEPQRVIGSTSGRLPLDVETNDQFHTLETEVASATYVTPGEDGAGVPRTPHGAGTPPPPWMVHRSPIIDGEGTPRTPDGAGIPPSPFGTTKRHRSPPVRTRGNQSRIDDVVDRRFKGTRHVRSRVTFNPTVSVLEPTGARSSSEIITVRTTTLGDDPTPSIPGSGAFQAQPQLPVDDRTVPVGEDQVQDQSLSLCIPASDSGPRGVRTKRKRVDTNTP